MRGLHDLNALRVPFISHMVKKKNGPVFGSVPRLQLLIGRLRCISLDRISHNLMHWVQRTALTDAPVRPMDESLIGLKVLDVGAGGGVLSAELRRKGAFVVAMEPSQVLCQRASEYHKADDCPRGSLAYSSASVNDARLVVESFGPEHSSAILHKADRPFDAVVISEVVEHIQTGTLHSFLASARLWTRPGGVVVLTTPNRTPLSRLLVILLAENVLRIMPKGSHQYRKFVKPMEVMKEMTDENHANRSMLIGHDAFVPFSLKSSWGTVFFPDPYPLGWVHYAQAYRVMS
eukprot:GHVH01007482.1.p1 GENE.GHVH01007482.1~~GHVH01007482.1.p1  ORF type:complete len:290 (+),score=23.33 GHVH01007482.1:189-1058(+)